MLCYQKYGIEHMYVKTKCDSTKNQRWAEIYCKVQIFILLSNCICKQYLKWKVMKSHEKS